MRMKKVLVTSRADSRFDDRGGWHTLSFELGAVHGPEIEVRSRAQETRLESPRDLRADFVAARPDRRPDERRDRFFCITGDAEKLLRCQPGNAGRRTTPAGMSYAHTAGRSQENRNAVRGTHRESQAVHFRNGRVSGRCGSGFLHNGNAVPMDLLELRQWHVGDALDGDCSRRGAGIPYCRNFPPQNASVDAELSRRVPAQSPSCVVMHGDGS